MRNPWPSRFPRLSFTIPVAAALFFLFVAAGAGAQTVSLRGDGWAFLAKVPDHWSQDRRSLYRQGIEALFLPVAATATQETAGTAIPSDTTDSGAPVAVPAYDPAGLFLLILVPGASYPDAFGSDAPRAGTVETDSFQTVDLYPGTVPGPGGVALQRLYGVLEDGKKRFVFLLSAPTETELNRARPALLDLIENFVLLGKE